jgi:hypothetical protein
MKPALAVGFAAPVRPRKRTKYFKKCRNNLTQRSPRAMSSLRNSAPHTQSLSRAESRGGCSGTGGVVTVPSFANDRAMNAACNRRAGDANGRPSGSGVGLPPIAFDQTSTSTPCLARTGPPAWLRSTACSTFRCWNAAARSGSNPFAS